MFKSKKNTLPPRPPIPDYKEILEDLNNLVSSNDIAFKLLEKENAFEDNLLATNNIELKELNKIYDRLKTYIDVSNDLRQVKDVIVEKEEQLNVSVETMLNLAQEIKDQAQAVLVDLT